MTTYRHLLVPTDFSLGSSVAIDAALDLAKALSARVTLVHVVELPASYMMTYAEGLAWPVDELDTAAKRELSELVAQVKKRHPAVTSLVVSGDPQEAITKAATEVGADLIVMATHGRRGLAHAFLGSVAERVVRTSRVPVLTVGPQHAK